MSKLFTLVALATMSLVAAALPAGEARAGTAEIYNCTDRDHYFTVKRNDDYQPKEAIIPKHSHRSWPCGIDSATCRVCLQTDLTNPRCSGEGSGPITFTGARHSEWRSPQGSECR